MTLLEALALAGSPTANASNEVIVVHPIRPGVAGGQPGSDAEDARIMVNRKDLELGKAGQDVVLQDGDIINVPSAQHFYITGMVRNPGTFVLDPGMNVQQAIALAGGLNDRGSDRRIKVSRLVNAKLLESDIELEDKIQAGDTVYDQRPVLLGSGSRLSSRSLKPEATKPEARAMSVRSHARDVPQPDRAAGRSRIEPRRHPREPSTRGAVVAAASARRI